MGSLLLAELMAWTSHPACFCASPSGTSGIQGLEESQISSYLSSRFGLEYLVETGFVTAPGLGCIELHFNYSRLGRVNTVLSPIMLDGLDL